jgi:ABC-2 type transport system ATP-binding protein
MEPTLELRGLQKRFGDQQAVADVSLAVPPGTVYGLLGPNGAGKTTTIRMLMDIIGPDAGEVRVFGKPRERRDLDRIGYLPEERGLYRKMTVKDQLVYLGELHGLSRRDLESKADAWLERLEIAARAKSKVEELSKGMQQKIQLAGTLLHEPELLVLDEPFSGLDPLNQAIFKEVLAQHKAAGRTVLFSTHVMEQAERICDHIALVANGRVVLEGGLQELKRRLGGNSYRVVVDGDAERVRATPGVLDVVQSNGSLRVTARPEGTSAELLRDLVAAVPVREFSSAEPTLEEIFVKAVRDAQPGETQHVDA